METVDDAGADPVPLPEDIPEFGPDDIKAWAVEHPTRAKALGLRLIQAGDADKLEGLESLGEFEDKATDWATKNPFKAKLLILSMVGMFKT